MQPLGTGLRKRAQIDLANRNMFLWVAGVSVVVGFALVGVLFLSQMLLFNERVLSEKNNTVKNLKSNIKVVKEIEPKVKKLDANQALISSKMKDDDQAIQVILDALPSEANSLALGASLQNVLLANIDGLTVQSLQVKPVAGSELLGSDGYVVDGSSTSVNEIIFNFSVSGDETALKQVLVNLEKSIRTIDIVSFSIESQSETRLLTVQGRAFFEPAVKVELKEKTVK